MPAPDHLRPLKEPPRRRLRMPLPPREMNDDDKERWCFRAFYLALASVLIALIAAFPHAAPAALEIIKALNPPNASAASPAVAPEPSPAIPL